MKTVDEIKWRLYWHKKLNAIKKLDKNLFKFRTYINASLNGTVIIIFF